MAEAGSANQRSAFGIVYRQWPGTIEMQAWFGIDGGAYQGWRADQMVGLASITTDPSIEERPGILVTTRGSIYNQSPTRSARRSTHRCEVPSTRISYAQVSTDR
jgi:hypothetical protein